MLQCCNAAMQVRNQSGTLVVRSIRIIDLAEESSHVRENDAAVKMILANLTCNNIVCSMAEAAACQQV
jgi:hypothetical protein